MTAAQCLADFCGRGRKDRTQIRGEKTTDVHGPSTADEEADRGRDADDTRLGPPPLADELIAGYR